MSLVHRKLFFFINVSCCPGALASIFAVGMITLLCKLKITEALIKPLEVAYRSGKSTLRTLIT